MSQQPVDGSVANTVSGDASISGNRERATLRRHEKLRLKSEFDRVRDTGRKFVGRLALMVVAESSDALLRAGVICGRKFSKKAVVRNRARRLIWESFRRVKAQMKPAHIVFIPRRAIMDKNQADVQRQLTDLTRKAGLWARVENSKSPNEPD